MDKEQEQLEFLGFIGVLKESFKIILSHPKIFSKISFTFILPLTFINLVNIEIFKFLSNKITNNSSTLYNQLISPTSNTNFSSKWFLYWGFEAIYFIFIFIIIFSLLSISAVVYTAACIYSGKEITFKQVMRAIPKVWKRLIITFFSNFCIVFAYNFAILLCGFIIIHGIPASTQSDSQFGLTITTMIIVLLLSAGLIYITIFWQLANVISVMENRCGFGAMKKSRELIKGKFGTAIAILLVQGLCFLPILLLNQQLLVKDSNIGIIGLKFIFTILILVLNPLITLYNLVVQTVFYCVCKSYHHENINKSNLSDHLEEFLGDYVPLLTETVEIV